MVVQVEKQTCNFTFKGKILTEIDSKAETKGWCKQRGGSESEVWNKPELKKSKGRQGGRWHFAINRHM